MSKLLQKQASMPIMPPDMADGWSLLGMLIAHVRTCMIGISR